MKKVLVSTFLSSFVGIAAPVFSATEGRTDDSSLLTYIFLAICGLIILFQLVPVLSMIKGLLKVSTVRQGEVEMEELQTVTSKYR